MVAGSSQDITYARQIIDSLCAPEMHGRGYVKNGHYLASEYLRREYKRIGLKHFPKDYFQVFNFSVNTFPAKLALSVNGEALEAGKDFIAAGHSGGELGEYPVVVFNKKLASSKKKIEAFARLEISKYILIVDDKGIKDEEMKKLFKALPFNPFNARGIILLKDKLTASYAQEEYPFPVLQVLRESWPKKARRVSMEVTSTFLRNVQGRNVVGYIEGTQHKDSFLVYTAHYDHMGRMGADHYFPGANDNASGVAMMLSLAKHYAKNPPKYSVVFIATGGEEVGLLGSKAFSDYPFFELPKIKFLLNMDILGTGDEGIKVVNATIFPEQFERLKALNEANNWLPNIGKRGKAGISDHYWFTEKGVPCFYFYTLGGIKAYHDIYDIPETLPLTEYEDLFRLIVAFSDSH